MFIDIRVQARIVSPCLALLLCFDRQQARSFTRIIQLTRNHCDGTGEYKLLCLFPAGQALVTDGILQPFDLSSSHCAGLRIDWKSPWDRPALHRSSQAYHPPFLLPVLKRWSYNGENLSRRESVPMRAVLVQHHLSSKPFGRKQARYGSMATLKTLNCATPLPHITA